MNALRQYREGAGLTQEQLGERVGASRWAISHYEAGRRKPADRIALRLERETGIDFRVLRGLVSQDERGPE